MNIEFVPSPKLREAERLLQRDDGESLRTAAVVLLLNKCEQVTNSENCAPLLNKILRKLTEDPYKCLSVAKTANANEIKRAYRQLALKVHPGERKTPITTAEACISLR